MPVQFLDKASLRGTDSYFLKPLKASGNPTTLMLAKGEVIILSESERELEELFKMI